MQSLRTFGAIAACLTGSLIAQTITLPANAAGVEGSTVNAFPWGLTSTSWPGLHIQSIYDSSNLTSQGITGAIVITAIRWRCNGGTAPLGGSFAMNTVGLAAATIDYTAISTTFQPVTTVYTGQVDVTPANASTPGAWYVTVPINPPFIYDPTTGQDLIVDTDRPGPGNWSGLGSAGNDIAGAGSLSSRTYASAAYPVANGITLDHGVVIELCYAGGSFTQFGAGCAGSLGIPGLAAVNSSPRIGTTFTAEVNNVPAGVSIVITGLNNTNSATFGALPFHGASAGAPGCYLRVSDEVTLLLLGGPTATWSLAIPNDPSFCGVRFFQQALVNSPGTNAAGWVISNAFAMIIGS